jgi:hypothetical protein
MKLIKIKVANLEDAALDWAVAKTKGLKPVIIDGQVWVIAWGRTSPPPVPFRPSTDKNDGWSFIESEKIATWADAEQWWATFPDTTGYTGSATYIDVTDFESVAGPTLLIAAMRCYVASKLGNEIDVPEELL